MNTLDKISSILGEEGVREALISHICKRDSAIGLRVPKFVKEMVDDNISSVLEAGLVYYLKMSNDEKNEFLENNKLENNIEKIIKEYEKD